MSYLHLVITLLLATVKIFGIANSLKVIKIQLALLKEYKYMKWMVCYTLLVFGTPYESKEKVALTLQWITVVA